MANDPYNDPYVKQSLNNKSLRAQAIALAEYFIANDINTAGAMAIIGYFASTVFSETPPRVMEGFIAALNTTVANVHKQRQANLN